MRTAGRRDSSPTCGGADAHGLEGSHLSLLGSALPRVHASDGASTQTSPRHLGKPEFPDTGWDRIKDLFYRDEGQMYSEELRNIIKSGVAAALVGMVYGGLPGARHARERFIQISQAEIYQNRMDAVRSVHNAAIRGFVRFGWRWSWRVAAFVTMFNTVSTGLTVYRDKNSLSHFAVAGALTGGVFRMSLGLGGLLAGTAIGAVLGLPAGVVIIGLQKLGGETMYEKRQRGRRELHELRVSEWNARLKLTEDLIGEMKCDKHQDTENDLRRIEELLSQPRNEKGAESSDSQ
ncbi:complex I assembly factor TIMMDC1, mitochondrial [Puntigrus tetrazona]|uniref:complex I assembly factor TIMMDC1, mitochondrial n=1 Tax=Puntigrus tetrazona TaxID=1606681 RepID=UPI001C8AD2F3|nr:complex I assembly factor TIMMDC1, mitochondrial [Puntigrus tetrazona]